MKKILCIASIIVVLIIGICSGFVLGCKATIYGAEYDGPTEDGCYTITYHYGSYSRTDLYD